jgi:hypothetical protein
MEMKEWGIRGSRKRANKKIKKKMMLLKRRWRSRNRMKGR